MMETQQYGVKHPKTVDVHFKIYASFYVHYFKKYSFLKLDDSFWYTLVRLCFSSICMFIILSVNGVAREGFTEFW